MSIVINNLYKRYTKRNVLKGLTYTFKDNTHYLIKGENGIGKSTLIKSILNQIKYEGEITVDGPISYSPEEAIFPAFMSVYSFLKTFSEMSNKEGISDEVIKKELNDFKILDSLDKQLGSLSKGTKMKINIILSLINPSKILLMDEPLSGLDPESKKKLLKKIKEDKRCVIVVSHETNQFKRKDFTILKLNEGLLFEI